jgi:hypothetical protein
MTNIYWREEKGEKNEVYMALMEELVECTDDAFEVKFGSDGAGAHVIVYVEVETAIRDRYPWKKPVPGKFMGWRVVKIFCPPTSIELILNRKED